MSEDQVKGASPEEQVIESARRNNVDLFDSLELEFKDTPEEFLKVLNGAHDATGDTALHLCCKYGCYEVMDRIIDFKGANLEPKNPMTGDTPLHYAANYSFQEPEYAFFLIEQLIEVGADPMVKNNDGLTPVDIVGGSNEKIKMVLQSAQYAAYAPEQVEIEGDEPEDDESN
ncbi:DEKNAAC101766 [Brettanomyces naardenensis]|uniref:DEKNAAC101766 n=1 Tax=Brettanomyces naardenensis TaxID=13370 RepID=A0A448YIH5_BRENA|nr:DEKNAAC101766 [Brettanomyces naardenensis]